MRATLILLLTTVLATADADVPVPPAARSIVDFWTTAGHVRWFTRDPAFDQQFGGRYAAEYAAASRGELRSWLDTPEGALALLILLDQYPRNAFRGSARSYENESLAVAMADLAVNRGHDRRVPDELAVFFYLPFAHSERLSDQERSVVLTERLGPLHHTFARIFRDIIRQFGRFPHRNEVLGRPMRPDERRYLDEGGYRG